MTHQAWLEQPYRDAEAEAERWESFCDMHEDDIRAELRETPDDYMQEELGEYVSLHAHLWMGDRRALMLGLHEQFEASLEAAVKRELEAKYARRAA